MKTEKKLQKWKNLITFGLLIAALTLVILILMFTPGADNKDKVYLTDHWDININGDLYKDVSLNQFFFPALNNKDELIMTTRLLKTQVKMAQIMVFTCHSTLQVYLDDELIYEYGMKRMEMNQILGYGNHFIALTQDYAGKELRFVMHVTEDNAFSSIEPVILDDSSHMIINYLANHRVYLFIGIFLIMFGLAYLFVTLIMMHYEKRFVQLLMIAFTSICIGIWTLSSTQLLQLIVPKLSFCTILEFISLYMVPIPALLYFMEDVKTLEHKLPKIIYVILLISCWIFGIAAYILQLCNIIHMPAELRIYHVLVVSAAIYILVLIYSRIRRNDLSYRLQMIGITIVIFVIFTDVVRFNLEKYTERFMKQGFTAFLPFGFVLFIFAMFVTFCLNMIENVYIKAKQDVLIQQAYVDTLTAIPNRRFCEEMLKQMEEELIKDDIGIMSIDLNGLKTVNDVMGHDIGDELIKAAAHILYDTFHELGTVGRMGGDEFIVICKRISLEQVSQKLIEMQQKIKFFNHEEKKFHVSLSYGYAIGYEVKEKEIKNIYILADNRMYEYKKKFKQRPS